MLHKLKSTFDGYNTGCNYYHDDEECCGDGYGIQYCLKPFNVLNVIFAYFPFFG